VLLVLREAPEGEGGGVIVPLPRARVESLPAPCSPEAEAFLLGCVLKRPALLDALPVAPALFFDPVNQRVWARLLWLRGQGPWDIATALMSFDKGTPEWERILAAPWEPYYWQAGEFVDLLRRTAEARRLLALAQDLAEAAFAANVERAYLLAAQASPPRRLVVDV
jgi:hypothetical protein